MGAGNSWGLALICCRRTRTDRDRDADPAYVIYSKLVAAVTAGDLPGFDRCMRQYFAELATIGVWLTFAELRLPTFRTFMLQYTAATYTAQGPPSGLALVEVRDVLARLGGADVTLDEVVWSSQQLLFKGYMKGYVTDLASGKPKVRFYRAPAHEDFLKFTFKPERLYEPPTKEPLPWAPDRGGGGPRKRQR